MFEVCVHREVISHWTTNWWPGEANQFFDGQRTTAGEYIEEAIMAMFDDLICFQH